MSDSAEPTPDVPQGSLEPIDADLTPAQLERLFAPLNERERALLLSRLNKSSE